MNDPHIFLRQIEWNILPPLLLSVAFQRDEHNHPLIPVLVSQIRISVTRPIDHHHDERKRRKKMLRKTRKRSHDDEQMFKIIVEYGTNFDHDLRPGHAVQWVVYRRYWDFVRLHYQLVGHDILRKKSAGLPRLPRLRQVHRSQRATTWHRTDLVEPAVEEEIQPDDEPRQRRCSSLDLSFNLGLDNETDPACLPDMIVDDSMLKYRALERYLYSLARALAVTPQINRFTKFLEISMLGLYLAVSEPNGYHGKEGYLTMIDRTDRQVIRTNADRLFCGLIARRGSRRTPKWFIVRESYLVVCADGPHQMAIEDVFMIDQAFSIERLSADQMRKSKAMKLLCSARRKPTQTLLVSNSQGDWYLKAKNGQQERQFFESIQHMAKRSIWSRVHPFGSYAPIRHHTSATWFVDGRDYFWEISVALDNAKESIYIHDWWLELLSQYLRRPACSNPEWRLDRVLQRKAEQGVKIYIIMYKEVAVALPLYSHYTKKYLMSLSDNIYVQRHPSRAIDIFNKNNILFWAHHEKICVVDNLVAFIGGIDLCFGRWDTYQHVVVDNGDPSLDENNTQPQIWPGKDYSNPRILDFHTLDKPFEDNMDRTKYPRMPWHDVSMRMTGQPARDVARHFVQRWNFLRRSKATPPKRPTPLLLVKPDLAPCIDIDRGDSRMSQLPTSHVCCIQLLRSVSQWSLGIRDHVEQSIQNAYVDVIENSEHFIYIENQFFVTATQCGSTKILNRIGDALVKRIIRAKREDTPWRAIIILPLVPGFQSEINDSEGSTVRLIMYCQYKSINRGPQSIFGRLKAAGIDYPEQYITFYGLRNWGELNGQLVTEQVYVHAKVLIADDRTVIIGSANINERSQLGNRDSEIAACIHDNEIIESTIRGRPARIGAFARSLRLRLMSEHLGVNLECTEKVNTEKSISSAPQRPRSDSIRTITSLFSRHFEKSPNQNFYQTSAVCTQPQWVSSDNNNPAVSKEQDVITPAARKSTSSTTTTSSNSSSSSKSCNQKHDQHARFWEELLCDPDIDDSGKENGDALLATGKEMNNSDAIRKLLFDPLSTEFIDMWHTTARRNSHIFRHAFLVMPDNNVRTWDKYDQFNQIAKVCLGRKDPATNGTHKEMTLSGARRSSNTTGSSAASDTEATRVQDFLRQVQGHLVVWPIHFLEDEDEQNEFLHARDKLAPLEIFD
ncbi:hypothetical protein BJV82DRAFT_646316 [Fennellomyces sp. T-0311]|nr:hypothetical protein BJV82DRAFT_646316 [Fennellomyces sp. T-0311]